MDNQKSDSKKSPAGTEELSEAKVPQPGEENKPEGRIVNLSGTASGSGGMKLGS